jgi:16S rRNA (guanine(1405)-N(7))-methyltransferase
MKNPAKNWTALAESLELPDGKFKMESLKKKILEKKELKGVPSDFLNNFLEEYKLKNPKIFKKLEEKNYNEKSKEFDEIKKAIRKKIRTVHGVFAKKQLSREKKRKYIVELRNATPKKRAEIIKEIIESHQSTFERINGYRALYAKIFENPSLKRGINKILDLGCGYNPFTYSYLECSPKYFAVDINKDDSEFIQDYFNLENIDGKSVTLDLTEENSLKIVDEESQNSDICLMLKLLDSLESKRKGSSEELFKHIHSKLIVVSFPLKTIGGKGEIKGKRRWFERIKNNKKYEIEEFDAENEKYYLLKQDNS